AALVQARTLADERVLAAALHARRIAIWGPDELPARLAIATELMHVAARAGDAELELEGRQWRLRALLEQGQAGAVDAQRRREHARAVELRQPSLRYKANNWQAARAVLEGRFAAVEAAVQGWLEEGSRAKNQYVHIDATLLQFSLRNAQGRLGELTAEF